MNENKKKLLKFYKFEYNATIGTYIARANLGELVKECSLDSETVERLGDEMLCKIMSSKIRKMKKSLAKEFLMVFNFYKFIKNTEGIEANVINPHFVTDTLIALDIFDENYTHYLGLVDAKLKKPKLAYFGEKEDRSLDCVSLTLKVIAKQFMASESGIKKYVSK